MAFLGTVGTSANTVDLAYTNVVIAYLLLGAIIGRYATNGGYVYVG